MDEKTIKRVKEHLESIAEKEGVGLDRVIVFGSRDFGSSRLSCSLSKDRI